MDILKSIKFNILLISSILIGNLFADLASPSSFRVKQPNGLSLSIYIRGNHLQNWHEHDGWTIVKNSKGWWVYAAGNNGNKLIPSLYKVGVDQEPNTVLSTIKRGIRPDPIILIDNSPVPNINDCRNDTFHIPMILIEFPDAFATFNRNIFEQIMNQEGYSHLNYENSGSFRDFYQEISYGQFLPHADVTDWIVAPQGHDYYAYSNPNGYSRVRELVRAMVDSLEENGFDWTKYDNDGDGYVDALNLLHQGPGAEEGDHTNIWSHKWSLGNLAVTYDGVTIDSYNMNPEFQNGNIVAIGVLAHEFGHALGLPDLYDTDYSSTGSGKLSLMASGSWGTVGNTPWYPATMIGWCKNQLGWSDVIVLENDQDNIQIQQSYSNNSIFRFNHPQIDEEYWLIENRQNVGSDTLMPSGGITIWHVNDDITDGWAVNNNEPYYGVGLEQADGMYALENGGPSNAEDIFPGNLNNREFSNSSTPNTSSLYGAPSMIRIDDISDPGFNMYFDIEFNDILLANVGLNDGSGTAYGQGWISANVDSEFDLDQFSFSLEFSPSFVEIVNVLATERTTFDSVVIHDNMVTLINPIIVAGSGNILDIELFNNVGVEANVEVQYGNCIAHSIDGNEIGITFDESTADYTIQATNQFFTIENGTGAINGSASYNLKLTNTVPIYLAVIEILSDSESLFPSDEPYDDMNENGLYDDGEPFSDWNQNGSWSPSIQPIDLDSTWNINTSISGTSIIITISNWDEPLEPAERRLFRINSFVESGTTLNDTITISTNVMHLLDKWGNDGVPFFNGNGIVVIDRVLSSDFGLRPPTIFAVEKIYPNPFNPTVSIDLFLKENLNGELNINVFDLKGRLVDRVLSKKNYLAGDYNFHWDASNFGSGIYFIRIETNGLIDTRKVTLLK